MLSLLAVMRDGKALETATVGREGVVGAMAGLRTRGEDDQLRAMLEAGMKTPAIALKLRRTVSAVSTRKTVLNKREAGLKAKK
jgi:hypothetical protein